MPHTAEPLRVGLAGLGTVGGSVARLLHERRGELAHRAGRPIELARVASRRPKPEINLRGAAFDTRLDSLVSNEVDVVVELIGGEDAAHDLVRQALQSGQHVVTANKALIAAQGNELFALARQKDRAFGFEAAVAGGIPIINALHAGLAANQAQCIAGIINGTSNYILSAMEEEGSAFADALAEAQRLGYAEADPTFDVEGIDAGQKLAILSALAFGTPIDMDGVFTQGISHVSIEDIRFARELGYAIKHLGIARRHGTSVEMRVHPTLVPESMLLGNIGGVTNAVMVRGDVVGETFHVGPGAGGDATASAVLSDLVALARDALPVPQEPGGEASPLAIDAVRCPFYLRIGAIDQPGVFAHVAELLGERDISIEAAIQHPATGHGNEPVPIVILTNPVAHGTIAKAVNAIESLDGVPNRITRIAVADM